MWKIKRFVKKLEDVPEKFRDLYREILIKDGDEWVDGGYSLDFKDDIARANELSQKELFNEIN